MRLADAEARTLAVRALRRSADRLEQQTKVPLPFEWTDELFGFLDVGVNFKSPVTGAVLYGFVCVLVSENKDDIEQWKTRLLDFRSDSAR